MYGHNTEVEELLVCNTHTVEGLREAGADEGDIEKLLPVIKELERKRKL